MTTLISPTDKITSLYIPLWTACTDKIQPPCKTTGTELISVRTQAAKQFLQLRLLRTFTGVLPCPPGKKLYAGYFEGKQDKLYIIGKVNKCRFREKNWISGFFNFAEENCKNDSENDHASFNQTNELIGYQISADFCDIWPEHSLDVVKQNFVGDFWNL